MPSATPPKHPPGPPLHPLSSQGTSEEEVVAQWMTPTQGGEITAEFFNKQTLHDFLTKRKKRGHGVLQKFVPPAGANVATIQAIWTPHLVLVEKRQNTQQLDDNRLDMGPRCITYEGPLHISRPSFVAPHIESKVFGLPLCTSAIQLAKSCHVFAEHHQQRDRVEPPHRIGLQDGIPLRGVRGASFGHFLYFRARCCVVKRDGRDHRLPHLTSQFVCGLLQTTHVSSKHACAVHALRW